MTATTAAIDAAHQDVVGREESLHVMCSVADNQTDELKQSPVSVTVTKFDSFYLSLRDIENERRNQCSDSLRRLRLRRYCASNTSRQSILSTSSNDYEEEDEQEDEDVFHIGDFELDDESNSHEVVQHAYGATKEVWEWGKSIPVLSNVLGLTEGVTTKFLQLTIHVDDVEKDLVIPNLKKLDDEVISPSIGTILNIIGPAVSVGEEVIVKPALHIVPNIPFLGQLVLGKNEEDEVKDAHHGPEVDGSTRYD